VGSHYLDSHAEAAASDEAGFVASHPQLIIHRWSSRHGWRFNGKRLICDMK
jgi:hypothetical protein